MAVTRSVNSALAGRRSGNMQFHDGGEMAMRVDLKRILNGSGSARRGAHERGWTIGVSLDGRLWLIVAMVAVTLAGAGAVITSVSPRSETSKLLPPAPSRAGPPPVVPSTPAPAPTLPALPTSPEPSPVTDPAPVVSDPAPSESAPPPVKPSQTHDRAPVLPRV